MPLNINVVNNALINVYQTGGTPRSYFGALGASGKFYPSGTTSTVISNVLGTPTNLPGFRLMSNTLDNLVDGSYPYQVTSSSLSPGFYMQIDIVDNLVDTLLVTPGDTSGYAIGDTITIDGINISGTGQMIFEVTQLEIDGLLIVIGGDFYEVKWYNLVVGGTSPTSLSDAQQLLATLFSTL